MTLASRLRVASLAAVKAAVIEKNKVFEERWGAFLKKQLFAAATAAAFSCRVKIAELGLPQRVSCGIAEHAEGFAEAMHWAKNNGLTAAFEPTRNDCVAAISFAWRDVEKKCDGLNTDD